MDRVVRKASTSARPECWAQPRASPLKGVEPCGGLGTEFGFRRVVGKGRGRDGTHCCLWKGEEGQEYEMSSE